MIDTSDRYFIRLITLPIRMTALSHTRTWWGCRAQLAVILRLGLLFLFFLTPHLSFGAVSPELNTLEQAKTQLEAGKTTRALETVEALIDSLPSPDILQDAYFLQATILEQEGKIAEALTVV
ncbi:MAG: tetratricopeptide repeat protein, partial [Nitrospirales bacterium]